MEEQWSPKKRRISIQASINFLLLLVILFCLDYIYIGFLFR